MIIVLMGVSGSGKTTIGRLLASRLGWEFIEGDDVHPPANKEKMRRGVPLDDSDREPWLSALAALLRDRIRSGRSAILACSALKRDYRRRLRVDPEVRFVYLKATAEQLARRLERRRGHFFPPDLLQSQFEALEEPRDALVVDASARPVEIVASIENELVRSG
jgi:gluconokinase